MGFLENFWTFFENFLGAFGTPGPEGPENFFETFSRLFGFGPQDSFSQVHGTSRFYLDFPGSFFKTFSGSGLVGSQTWGPIWLVDRGTTQWKWMAEVPCRTHPSRPLVCACFSRSGSKGALDFQGRRGITSIVRWNLRPVIFGVDKLLSGNIFPGRSFIHPPPHFWLKGIFQGRGGGGCMFWAPTRREFYTPPPPFIRPPPPRRVFVGVGGLVGVYKIRPRNFETFQGFVIEGAPPDPLRYALTRPLWRPETPLWGAPGKGEGDQRGPSEAKYGGELCRKTHIVGEDFHRKSQRIGP